MSDPFEAIKAKKAKILADAERAAAAVDADMRELEKAQAIANKYGLTLTQVPAPRVVPDLSVPPPPMHGYIGMSPGDPAYKKALFVSEKTIREARVPLDLSILYDACVRANVPLAGKRPQSTLSAYLAHKSSRLESIRRGVYWLKGVPVPVKDRTDTPDGGYVNGRHILDDDDINGSELFKAAVALAWRDDPPSKS